MGKLYVIESGTDGSGKATQTEKIFKRLLKEGYPVMKVEYPNYKSESSALIKMYLSGVFGADPNEVNPYATSIFFAADRFVSYKTEWEKFYENGGIIIADRYTTSNMIHQAGKIHNIKDKEKFLDWLWDLEFIKIGLPVPDKVFFLDVPLEFSEKLMENRKNKFNETSPKDIHERNKKHLEDAYYTAKFVAEKYNWVKIKCTNGKNLKSIEEIHEIIYKEMIKEIG